MMEQGGLKKWEVGWIPKIFTWNHYVQLTLSTTQILPALTNILWFQTLFSLETYYKIAIKFPCFYAFLIDMMLIRFKDILCLCVAISKLYILFGEISLFNRERKIASMVHPRVLLNLLQFSSSSHYHSFLTTPSVDTSHINRQRHISMTKKSESS